MRLPELFIVGLLLLSSYSAKSVDATNTNNITDSVPGGVKKLLAAYPDVIVGFNNNRLFFRDKTALVWNDGKIKAPQTLIDSPDLEDMFAQRYTRGVLISPPKKGSDPGRIRNEQLFKKLYGSTQTSIAKNLTEINWCPKLVGKKIRVTRLNGVARQLDKVSKELDEHPELKKYLTNIGGTFNWRYINGTRRLSTHSFGMTIDINTAYSDYWQWTCKCVNENIVVPYMNRIPQVIVDAFEKQGFIWGGKWYHYDTMHFEYRPELLN